MAVRAVAPASVAGVAAAADVPDLLSWAIVGSGDVVCGGGTVALLRAGVTVAHGLIGEQGLLVPGNTLVGGIFTTGEPDTWARTGAAISAAPRTRP